MRDDAHAYLFHLLAWGLPVLALQLAVLFWRCGRVRAWRLLGAVVPPALGVAAWLCAADGLAIQAGIWRFGKEKLSGLGLGPLPLEEGLFFVLSNLLIAVGLALFGELRSGRAAA